MFFFYFVLYIRVIWVRGSKMRFDEDSAQNRRQKGNPRNYSTMMCAILCYGQNMSKHVKTCFIFPHKKVIPPFMGFI
jgi:hypothetical protein